ncbi:MAG: hypothetical protein ABIW79_00915 [Gemmatimonas sp.]
MRTKREYRSDSRENYNRFIKENNLTEKELSYSKYTKNINICNWMFIEYALETGIKVFLPYGFGPLAVNKKKLKRYKEFEGKKYINLRIDWAKTKKLGKKIYHTNEHTEGYNYKWLWFPKETKLYLADCYVFNPCRYASRAINKYLTKPNSPYKDMYLEWVKYK